MIRAFATQCWWSQGLERQHAEAQYSTSVETLEEKLGRGEYQQAWTLILEYYI